MEVIFCGSDFNHKKGEFSPRLRLNSHFISFFKTDFVYEKNGELLRGSCGDMMIIPRGEIVWHGPTPEMTEGFRNDWMHIEGDDFIELVKKYELPIGTLFKVGGHHTLSHCIQKIKAEQATCSDGYREMCDVYIREAIIKLHRKHQNELSNSSDEKIKNMRVRLIDEIQKEWTLKSMAEACGYSPSHFSFLYSKIFNISPIADLINIRIESSKSMLTYSSMSISEICYAVGFSNIYYYSKCFKKNTGMSPTQYRHKFEKPSKIIINS